MQKCKSGEVPSGPITRLFERRASSQISIAASLWYKALFERLGPEEAGSTWLEALDLGDDHRADMKKKKSQEVWQPPRIRRCTLGPRVSKALCVDRREMGWSRERWRGG